VIENLNRAQERELSELREYLGSDYDHALLEGSARAVQDEREALGSEEELYRRSQAYLYDLTVFAMSETKRPYLDVLRRTVEPGALVLDYGCGIGSDGLTLLEGGYRVAFADFDNPSTRYLRWRLARRGFDTPIYDLDRDRLPDRFDLAYSFDVIEHVPDPFAFLRRMESHARLVLVNFLVDEAEEENALHRELPLNSLLEHAAGGHLHHYGRYHGRSHLVLYEARAPAPVVPLRSRVALWRGRLSARARDALRGYAARA
jgi:SAM-dependent methyltransferase